jgi:hypothetical protein
MIRLSFSSLLRASTDLRQGEVQAAPAAALEVKELE